MKNATLLLVLIFIASGLFADSLNVSLVGQVGTFGIVNAINVVNDYAYLASDTFGLRIIDVSDPNSPFEIGYYNTGDRIGDVYVAGNYAYLAADSSGIRIVDVSDPSTPAEIGLFETDYYAREIYLDSNYLYIADIYAGVIIDVSAPSSPVEIGYFNLHDFAINVYVVGDNAFVAEGYDGLRIVDISDPSSPYEVGYFNPSYYVSDFCVSGNYCYIQDGSGGFRIIDISDPSSPLEVECYDTDGLAYGLVILNDIAYWANYGNGFRIIDVSIPTSPHEVGYYETGMLYFPYEVYVSGNYAYVSATDATIHSLFILNISHFTDPPEYTLFLESDPPGGPTFIDGILADSITVPESTVVQISCVATFPGASDTTYTFSHWSCGGSRTRNYTVTANETLTAYYDTVVTEYTLSLLTNPTGGQTYIDGAPSSSTTVPSGTEVEISCQASFSSGGSTYNFSHWSCGGARTQDYTVNSTETLTAYYDTIPSDPFCSIDSVWFWEETVCNDSNIIHICYELDSLCPESTYNISARISADFGASWFSLISLMNDSGNLGEVTTLGTHCFDWVMSEDMPDTEGCEWVVEISIVEFLDTFVVIDSISTSSCGSYGVGLSYGDGYYWIYEKLNGLVYQKTNIHPDSLPVDSFYIGSSITESMSYFNNGIYYGAYAARSILRIDITTGVVDTLADCGSMTIHEGILVANNHIYISENRTPNEDLIAFDLGLFPPRITVWDTIVSEPIGICSEMEGMAYALGYLWGCNNEGRMVQIDLSDSSLVGCYPIADVEDGAEGLCWDGQYLWYCNTGSQNIYKIYISDSTSSRVLKHGCLDSDPPLVYIDCPVFALSVDEAYTFEWKEDDMFFSDDPCSLHFFNSSCGIDESHVVTDTFFTWTPTIACDACTMVVAVRDSFCNWGYDTCVFDIDTLEFEDCGTVTDIDGNVYETIVIGCQCWMRENLKTTHYNNGDSIPNVTSNSSWSSLTSGAYCEYNNDTSNVATYGRLYNWYAVDDPRDLAPEGWHIPTDEDWKELEIFLGMTVSQANSTHWRGTNQGSKLAGVATFWNDGELENDPEFNTSGLYAIPSASRNESGSFGGLGEHTYFWTSTESDTFATCRELVYNHKGVWREDQHRNSGYSIRCVRDISPCDTCSYNIIPDYYSICASGSLEVYLDISDGTTAYFNVSCGGIDTVEYQSIYSDTTIFVFSGCSGAGSLYLVIWDSAGVCIGDTGIIEIIPGPEFDIIADPASDPCHDPCFYVWTTADPLDSVIWEWDDTSYMGDTLWYCPDSLYPNLYATVYDWETGCSNTELAVYQPGHPNYFRDDTICCGDSIWICAGSPGVDSIQWYIGLDTTDLIPVKLDSTWCFWLTPVDYEPLGVDNFVIAVGRYFEGDCEYIDYINITISCPEFEIIGDTLVCPGDTTVLCIEPPGYPHHWWDDGWDTCLTVGPIWDDTTVCVTVWDTSYMNCIGDTQAVDIVFYLDTSGSMQGEIDEVRDNVVDFSIMLEAEGFDCQFGDVTFIYGSVNPWDADLGSVGNNLTSDVIYFRNHMNSIHAAGGTGSTYEYSYTSLMTADVDITWRSSAVPIIILFTDEPPEHAGLRSHVISQLQSMDAIVFMLSTSSYRGYYEPIALANHGEWYNITEPLSDLLPIIVDRIVNVVCDTIWGCPVDTCVTIHVLDEIDKDTSMCVLDTMKFCCNPICDSLGGSRAGSSPEIMVYHDGTPVSVYIAMDSDSCCMKFVPHDPGTYSVWQPNYYDGIHDCCYDVWWHITVCCTPQGSLFVSTLYTLHNGAITYRVCFEEVLAYPYDTCCDIDSIAWHYSIDSSRYSCLDDSDCNCSPSPCYCQKGRYNCYGFGNCVPVPDIVCPTYYMPVCGCDGRTYGNSCSALESGINIAYDGECHSIDPLPLIDTLSGIYCDTVTINCFDTVEVCVSAYNFCEGIICSIRVCDTLIGDSCCVCPDCDPKFTVISPLDFELLTDSLCPWEDLQVCMDLVGDSCPELDSVHWNIFMAPGLDLGITRCITIPYDSLILEEPILFPVPGWHRFCAEGYYTPPDCYTYCTYNLCDSVYIHPCDSCCKLVINIECEGDPVCDTVCPGDSVLLCAVLIGDNCPSPDSIDPEWTRDGIRISSFPCAKVAPDSTSTYCFTGWYELASGDTCSYDTCVTIWVISAPNEDLWPEDTILCVGDSLVLLVPCYPYIPIGWEDSTATISPSYIAAFAYEDSITESDPDTIAFLDISSLPPSWCYVSNVARVPGCWEHIVCYDVYTEECGWYKWVECCTIYVCDTPSVQITMDSVVCPDKEMAEICVTNINTSASMDTIVWISSGGTQITVWPDTCVSIPLNVITTPCGGINSFQPETVIVKAGHKCIDCGPDEIICWDYDTVVIKPSFEFGLDFRPPAVHPGDPFTIYPWTNPSFAGVFPPVEWDIQQCRNDSLVGVLRHNAFGDSVIVSYTDSTTVYCCWFTYQGCEYWACDTMVFSETLLTIIKAPCAGDPDGWQELDGGRVYDECIHTFPVSGGSANICVSDTDFVMTDVWMFDYWSLDDIGASAYSLESCTTYTLVSSHDTIYAQYQEQSMCLSVVPVQSDSSFLTIEGTLLLVDTLELGIDYIDPLIVSVCDTIITGMDTLILCPGESFTALNINDPKKFEFTNCGTAILSIKVKWNSLDILSPWCSSIMLTNSAIPGTNELGLRFSYSTSPGIPTSYSVLKNYYQELLPDLNPGVTNYLYMGVVAPNRLEGCYGPIPSIPLRIQLTIVWGVSLP